VVEDKFLKEMKRGMELVRMKRQRLLRKREEQQHQMKWLVR
jgi:hypothetical protein